MKFDELCEFVFEARNTDYLTGKDLIWSATGNDGTREGKRQSEKMVDGIVNAISDEEISELQRKMGERIKGIPINRESLKIMLDEVIDFLPAGAKDIKGHIGAIIDDMFSGYITSFNETSRANKIQKAVSPFFNLLKKNQLIVSGIPKSPEVVKTTELEPVEPEIEVDVDAEVDADIEPDIDAEPTDAELRAIDAMGSGDDDFEDQGDEFGIDNEFKQKYRSYNPDDEDEAWQNWKR